MFKVLLDIYFSDFKRYRKWRGGTWYKVREEGTGFASPIVYWTQIRPAADDPYCSIEKVVEL